MKTKHKTAIATALSTFVLVMSMFFPNVRAQILPSSLGEVAESKRTPVTITRSPIGSRYVSKSSNGVIFVLTDPPNAEIAINGKYAAKAINGEFRKELPSGVHYTITVCAGPEYEPITKTVVTKSGGSEVVRAALVSKYGLVRIGPAIDGAKLFIDDQQMPPDKVEFEKASNTVKVDNVIPGDHKITYQHPDYVPLERRFKISPSSEYLWTFKPEPATVELTIQSDPDALVYIDDEPKGKIPADGILKLTDTRLGTHVVKVIKEDHEEYTEKREFNYHQPARIEKELAPLPTSAEFSDDFDIPKPNLWTARSGAAFKGGRLQLENATALCTPTDIRYRDFEMSFHLILGNAAGAAWAVRVRDSSSYYLFFLSGPEGRFPNRFNTYIVRNNEFDPDKHFLSNPIIVRLVAGGQYDIHIIATRNRIEHQIIPADTGKAVNLGFFEDPNSTFLLGGIGFRTVASERFSIDELLVKPR